MPTTTYMGMVLPTVSVTLGPQWATELNAALAVADAHDHSSGKGKQVPSSGLNINADVSWGGYNVTSLKSARYTSQGSPLGGASDVNCVYVSSGNLYYNNASGTQIQLTSGGSLNVAGISTNFWTRRAVSTDITIGAADTDVWYDIDTSGARIITLPSAAAVTAGRFYVFSDTTGSAGTNAVTINRAGSDTIEGGTSTTIASNYASLALVSDGTSKWKILRYSDITRLNGATVPASGSLTTGNVLQVSGSNALSYGAINLAGGSNYVTGALPWSNIATPIAASHYATTGVVGGVQLAQDLGGTALLPTVLGLTGTAGVVALHGSEIKRDASAGAATDTIIRGQTASGANDGGNVVVWGGERGTSGDRGGVVLGTGDETPLFHAARPGGRYVAAMVLTGGLVDATAVPGGNGVVFVGNATTAPSTNPANEQPVGGFVFYSDAGYPAFKVPNGQTTKLGDVSVSGSLTSANNLSFVGSGATAALAVTINGTAYKIPLYT